MDNRTQGIDQRARARRFRELNLAGGLILPNVWDAASARVFEKAGFVAIGTTSAGIAYTRGLRDAQLITRDEMIREIANIAAAVTCLLTVDVEAGYGELPADVASTVEAVLDAGAIGINLEDAAHGRGRGALFSPDEQAARIAAARACADRREVALVVNARTDVFLANLGADIDERVTMAVERGNGYLRAGADVVFVPGLIDPALVRRVSQGLRGPLNLMATPAAPAAAELFAAGAKRVSIGPFAMLATLRLVCNIAAEIRRSGTWSTIAEHPFGPNEAEALFD